MRKIVPLFVVLVSLIGMKAFALDPVAPKADRAFGFVKVESPLPSSDSCQLTGKNDFKQTFKSGEMMKVPVGDYNLVVKLQNSEWSNQIKVSPTEYTKVVVTGFGNLKINTPHPAADKVEVFSQDGKLVKSFNSSDPQTLPTGTYSLKIKVGRASTIQNNVVIVTNTTRELDVSGGN